jgi:hypothetical protein
MPKPSLLAPLALALALAMGQIADAASLTPPNLVAATSLNNPDLLLVWPYAAGGPLEQMSWSVFKGQMASGLAGSFLVPSNNLSDLGNPTIARTNLGLSIGTSGANVCLLDSACTWSVLQSFAASTTAGASLNIAPGVAPTSPNNGDVWGTNAGGFYGQVNGSIENFSTVQSGTYTPSATWGTPGTSTWSSVSAQGSWYRYGSPGAGHECHIYAQFSGIPTLGTASGGLNLSLPTAISVYDTYVAASVAAYSTGFKSLTGPIQPSLWFSDTSIGLFQAASTGLATVTTSNVTNGTNITVAVDIWTPC